MDAQKYAFANTFVTEVFHIIGDDLLFHYPGVEVKLEVDVRQQGVACISMVNMDRNAQRLLTARLNNLIYMYWRHSISHVERKSTTAIFFPKTLDHYLHGNAVRCFKIFESIWNEIKLFSQ